MSEGVRDQTVPIPKKQFDPSDEAQFRRQMERFMQDTRGRISRLASEGAGGGLMVPHSGRWWTAGIVTNDASANATLSNENRLWLLPLLPNRDAIITDLALEVETLAGSSNARIGLYRSGAATGLPTTLVESTADLDCSTTGVKSDTLSSAVSLTAGTLYWVGLALKGGTPSVWADAAVVGAQLGKATAARSSAEDCVVYEDIGAWTSLPDFGTADGYIATRPFVALKIG